MHIWLSVVVTHSGDEGKQRVGYGTCSKDRRWRLTRHVANQCETEPVSLHTLQQLMEVAERLWTSP